MTGFATILSHGWSSIEHVTQTQWLTLIYLGSIASGISFFWWNKGAILTHAVMTLAILNNLKIPLGVLVSLVIFSEQTNMGRLILSCALIGLSLILSEQYKKHLKPVR